MAQYDASTIKDVLEIALDKPLAGIDADANFYTDYGLDSMSAVAFFVELQRRTKVAVPEAEAANLNTARLVLQYINAASHEKVSQQG